MRKMINMNIIELLLY